MSSCQKERKRGRKSKIEIGRAFSERWKGGSARDREESMKANKQRYRYDGTK